MNRVSRIAVLGLALAPAAAPASAQGYHWLRQSWHLTASHLSGRLEVLLHSSAGKTEFIKAADNAIALQDSERNARLARAFRALLVARDAQYPAWPPFREAVREDLKALRASTERTASEDAYLEAFAKVVFKE